MKIRESTRRPGGSQRISEHHSRKWHEMGLALALVTLLMAGSQTMSQQQPAGNQPPITVKVKVVNVLATVRNKKGEIVRNLDRNDFTLEDDGRPQEIRYFSHESDLPLTLGLLVDTSMSQRRVLGEERTASAAFLDQVMRADKDKAFVIHFDHEVELLQDLTSSRQKLQTALDQLTTRQGSDDDRQDSPDSGQEGRRGPGGRGGGMRGRFGTTLYDAVYLSSNEVTSKQEGRKALIVLSDGVDRGSKKTLADAIAAAQRADTIVYSILFADEQRGGSYGRPGMGGGMGRGGGMGGGMGRGGGGQRRYPQESRPDGKKILEQLSRQSGGRLFEVSKKHPIEETYNQIQEELRNQYSLGYTPNHPGTESAYHKITLTANRKDLIVQARDGYYSGK